MAIVAFVTVVIEFVSFDDSYFVDDPMTGEQIEVMFFLDDPYTKNYLITAAAFGLAAISGFASRKRPLPGLVASIALVVLVLLNYDRRLFTQEDFMYILFAFFGLAGSITYFVCHLLEKRQEATEFDA